MQFADHAWGPRDHILLALTQLEWNFTRDPCLLKLSTVRYLRKSYPCSLLKRRRALLKHSSNQPDLPEQNTYPYQPCHLHAGPLINGKWLFQRIPRSKTFSDSRRAPGGSAYFRRFAWCGLIDKGAAILCRRIGHWLGRYDRNTDVLVA
jgi:hypothetical protein